MTNWFASLWSRLRRGFRTGALDTIDPEVGEVFLSELDEIAASLSKLLARWRQRRSDSTLLQEIRRGFHTLKGSGLAVGAKRLGTYCARIENLVLDLIERPDRASPDAVAAIEQAIDLLPDCARALRAGKPLPAALELPGTKAGR